MLLFLQTLQFLCAPLCITVVKLQVQSGIDSNVFLSSRVFKVTYLEARSEERSSENSNRILFGHVERKRGHVANVEKKRREGWKRTHGMTRRKGKSSKFN